MQYKTSRQRRLKLVVIFVLLVLTFVTVFFISYKKEDADVNYLLHEDIQNYLKKNGVSNCNITQCPNYKHLIQKYSVNDSDFQMSVTDDEVQEYVDRIMQSYDKLINLDKRKKVKSGDFVTVEYSVYYKGEVIERRKTATVKVGSGKFDEQFESVLIGMEKGKTYKRELVVPDTYEDSNLVGKKEVFKIRVIAIQKYVEQKLTDEFVKKELSAGSVKAYYRIAREKVLMGKKSEKQSEIANSILNKVISECRFDLDTGQIAQYALQSVVLQEQLANVGDMSLEEYINENYDSKETFYQEFYSKAEMQIKQDLVIGAIAAQAEIKLSKKVLKELSDESNESERYALLRKAVLSKFGVYKDS